MTRSQLIAALTDARAAGDLELADAIEAALPCCPRCHALHGMSPGMLCSWCAWGWGRNPSAPPAQLRAERMIAERGKA